MLRDRRRPAPDGPDRPQGAAAPRHQPRR